MTISSASFVALSDHELLTQLESAVGHERQATAHVIALLMEVDSRKLYAQQSCSSLFTLPSGAPLFRACCLPSNRSGPCGPVKPLAPERFKVQFTVSRETHDKLRQAQDLLRHTVPDGDVSAIFDRALTVLLAELSKTKFALTDRPRRGGERGRDARHVPAAVKREVWRRDEGQCAFRGERGRCTETAWLEFHHVIPFGRGGPTTTGNIELRCRAHNVYEAEKEFGTHALPFSARECSVHY